MKKRLFIGIIVICLIMLSSLAVWAATETVEVKGIVGQFKLFLDGELNHNDDLPNYYWSESQQQFLPLTIVHEGKVYVPIDMLNQNVEYTMDKKTNSIYFTSKPIFNSKAQENFLKNSVGKKPTNTNTDTTSDDDLRINKGEIEFTDKDLNFSRYANFLVGTDIKSKFYNFYSKWVKHSEMINKTDHRVTFYEKEEFQDYHLFDIVMIYNVKTNIVKDVTFMEWAYKPANAKFKTYRNVTTQMTMSKAIKAYGDTYSTSIIKDDNGFEINAVEYKFYSESYEAGRYTKGTLTFYSYIYPDEKIEDSTIMGIRLKVND